MDLSNLVRYLYTCHDCGNRKIKFREDLVAGNLDIFQAAPLGLILNEAITILIKYTFDKDGDEMMINAQ